MLFVFYIWSFPISLLNVSVFFRRGDAKELAGDTSEGMRHFIIFEGQLHSPDDIYISAEQEILLKIDGGIPVP